MGLEGVMSIKERAGGWLESKDLLEKRGIGF